MKHSLKIVALLAALTFAVQPLEACFSEEMTVSEEQCCIQMAGDCGQVSMPTSHSCCRYVDRADTARPEAKNALVSMTIVAVISSGSQTDVPAPAPTSLEAAVTAESPPGNPSRSLQVLRI